jgi:alkanesulfonate monooxygenase SsuD/methylene tetrahydromethanopterin reductase-like flavin-dependent oxidoreductase (luciferase family)
MGLSAYISVGRSLETALQRVELAESHGYGSVFNTHIAGRDSVTTLMAYASRSQRVRLGTGVMPIYSRTPVATAQSFATLDEFSGGRAIVGLGVSHRSTVTGWYGQELEKPVRDMREYAGIVRAILRGEDPPQGERFRSHFHFMGYEPRPDIPIYVAGLSPRMLRLAGEIGDGVMLWLCNPSYIADVVVPAVTEGRERAGKGLEGFDVVAAVPAAVTGEPGEARARLRQELAKYFQLPFYRAMLERSGYEDDVKDFDDRGIEAISDRFLEALAAIGKPEEAAASIGRYRDAGVTSPAIGPVARTDFDVTLESLAASMHG